MAKDRQVRIIPTVFAASLRGFQKRLSRLETASREIQIDIMDGRFVKAKSVPLERMPDLRKKKASFEAHLMVNEPANMLHLLKKKGFRRAIAHIEALKGKRLRRGLVEKFIKECRKEKMECGLAIKPETPISKVRPYLRRIDVLLFLGVKPGKEGQRLISGVVRKIEAYGRIGVKTPSQIDGGVSQRTAGSLSNAGVTRFNTGAYTARARSPKRAIKSLEESIKESIKNAVR